MSYRGIASIIICASALAACGGGGGGGEADKDLYDPASITPIAKIRDFRRGEYQLYLEWADSEKRKDGYKVNIRANNCCNLDGSEYRGLRNFDCDPDLSSYKRGGEVYADGNYVYSCYIDARGEPFDNLQVYDVRVVTLPPSPHEPDETLHASDWAPLLPSLIIRAESSFTSPFTLEADSVTFPLWVKYLYYKDSSHYPDSIPYKSRERLEKLFDVTVSTADDGVIITKTEDGSSSVTITKPAHNEKYFIRMEAEAKDKTLLMTRSLVDSVYYYQTPTEDGNNVSTRHLCLTAGCITAHFDR